MTAMLTMLSRRIGLAAAVLVPVIFPVLAQDFGEQSMKPAGPPVEIIRRWTKKPTRPRSKIPPPKEKYDPWGTARPSEQAKPRAK